MTARPDPGAPPVLELEPDAAARYAPAGAAAPGRGPGAGPGAGHDRRLQRDVAVEVMDGDLDPAAVARFVAAARLQGRLEHPAIVPVLDVGLDPSGRPYVVLRRVHGVPLADVLARRAGTTPDPDPRFATRRLLAAFVDVCLAIAYAHARGVAHRGLGAARVLLGEYGEVYVRGWGDAVAGDADGEGDGAPGAEQAADVRALAGVLFEILGHAPLPDGHADATALARAALGHVPPELLDAIAAATASPPRITRAAELADAVQRWLHGVRDLARRREVAARHRARARAALAAGDRTTAMREAGAAVALAPGDAAAAELLGRMVVEPPAEDSAAGAAAIAQSDLDEVRAQAKVASRSYLAVPAFLPLLAWPGVVAWPPLVAIALLGIGQAVFAATAARGRFARSWVAVSTLSNLAVLALFTRIYGPLIAVPAMAVTIVMAASALPWSGPRWLIPGAAVAAVLGPWVAEAAGLLAPTTWLDGTSLVIASPTVALPRGPTLTVLALHSVALLFVAADYARQQTVAFREARQRLLSQAWHLEQLAPVEPGPLPEPDRRATDAAP